MLTIYHNPRCSKSRQTLALLDAANTEHSVHLYLNEPLDPDELNALKLSLKVNSCMEMIRTKEPEFKIAKLSATSSEDELLSALVQYPKLLERPIVSNGTQAIIGRPPENVNVLL